MEEKEERELRRKAIREHPEVRQWLHHMKQGIKETEDKLTVSQFNRSNRTKQKKMAEQSSPTLTLGAYGDGNIQILRLKSRRRTAKKKISRLTQC